MNNIFELIYELILDYKCCQGCENFNTNPETGCMFAQEPADCPRCEFVAIKAILENPAILTKQSPLDPMLVEAINRKHAMADCNLMQARDEIWTKYKNLGNHSN